MKQLSNFWLFTIFICLSCTRLRYSCPESVATSCDISRAFLSHRLCLVIAEYYTCTALAVSSGYQLWLNSSLSTWKLMVINQNISSKSMAYELLMSKIKVGKHQLLRNQIVNLVFSFSFIVSISISVGSETYEKCPFRCVFSKGTSAWRLKPPATFFWFHILYVCEWYLYLRLFQD